MGRLTAEDAFGAELLGPDDTVGALVDDADEDVISGADDACSSSVLVISEQTSSEILTEEASSVFSRGFSVQPPKANPSKTALVMIRCQLFFIPITIRYQIRTYQWLFVSDTVPFRVFLSPFISSPCPTG